MKLNQVIAITNGVKKSSLAEFTNVHKTLQRNDAFTGFRREYSPVDEEGERLNPENKLIQETVEGNILAASVSLRKLFNVVSTQEFANTNAKADVVVDDVVVLNDVPVTYLLFLEKQLVDLRTFFSKVPVLSSDTNWTRSTTDENVFQSETTSTIRTKKVPRVLVKYEATEKHPAQTEVFTEDVTVGTWKKTDVSSAISSDRQKQYLSRVDKLLTAVKMAREEANSLEVGLLKTDGDKVLDFILS